MSTGLATSLLGQLVKEVDKNYVLQDPAKEELLVIDSGKNITRGKPRQFSIFKTYRYFVVKTDKTVSFEGYMCTISGKHGSIRLVAAYTIACEHADLITLILNISAEKQASKLPNSLIQEEIEKMASANGMAEDFYKSKKDTEQRIVQVLKNYGITARSFEIQPDDVVARLQFREITNDQLRINMPGQQSKITVAIKLKARVQKGKETMFLASNINNDNIEYKLYDLITEYFNREFSAQQQADDFNTSVSNAIETKIDNYLGTIGLELEEFGLFFPNKPEAVPVRLESADYMDVRLSDSRQIFRLKYKCELLVNNENQANLYLRPVAEKELQQVVENQLKLTLSRSVVIASFLDRLNTEVAVHLAEAIDEKIMQWGRSVGYMHLELDDARTPPRFLEVQHNINCKSQDGHDVTVNNTLMLQRNFSVNKVFEAYQIDDFTNWAKAELERITKSHIITQTYNQLLYDFKDFKLKEEFKTEADKIGYHVDQLIILPQFDPSKKSERFRVQYSNLNLNSKIDGITLAVSVNAEGRINSFKRIMSLLAPKESIELSMEKYIGDKISQFFNSVDPDRFYLRFNTMDIGAGDKTTLENELRELVTKALIEEYDAEIRSVTVKQLDTPLINRFKQLREGVFECFFQDKTGFFKYKARIDVLNVDPEKWSIFNSKGYKPRSEDPGDQERNDIRTYIGEYVENGLNTDLVPDLKKGMIVRHEDFVDEIRRLLDEVTVEIRDMFGLNIRIYKPLKLDPEGNPNKTRLDFQVYETETELKIKKQMYDLALNEKMNRLKELYERRRNNSSHFSNAPELKKINEEINEIENSLKPDEGPLQLDDPFN